MKIQAMPFSFIKKGISGSTLKMIAIVVMMLDHVASIILERMLIFRGMWDVADAQSAQLFIQANQFLVNSYSILKYLGRIAFPIFCFQCVEGFLHTKNVKKYLTRMFLFALVSEIPFDLAFFGVPFYWGYQNVFWTLLFGIIALKGIQIAESKTNWNMGARISLALVVVGACLGIVWVLQTDYQIYGVLMIVILYLLRKRKLLATSISCLLLQQVTALGALLPIGLYNGEKGRNMKWIFYWFYPAHILILYLVACAMGLGGILF